MKDFDYSEVKEYRFYDIIMPVFKLLSKMLYRVKYVGKENVPKTGGIIIAANHYNTFDPGFIGVSGVRKIHFMTKGEKFAKPYPNWLYTHVNAFPIKRGAADKSAVEFSIKVIKQGYALGIFPEGTRSKDGIPQAPKAGVALIAREAKADVVPVSIYSQGKVKLFSKIIVRFGKPIPYEALGFTSGGKASELRAASRLIMNEIIALREKKFED
ncbi:MAG TPA: lysophospholipid acyltransferase family protein [Clostridia bacterium]|nr:lysophospholipid acyltransferase family protein [Clostridia bacterium]